ncbi:hypothetical protein [Cupriavidus metallidurans]|uniref:hypothetical protein n=1 Tax=Cupriavidus metallidurans TaxID=119219 RepID=UPI001BFCBF91|nr:hypothetical protein [Cupriavidus metallidurans]QWC87781.1 hypothetical protein KB891_12090 [Cupriavidus metallidurans]
MTAPEHVAVLLKQGATWIQRASELECWSDEHEAEAHRRLQACPLPDLPEYVERLRQRMWCAMEQHGALPAFTRTINGKPVEPPAPPPRRARGLAKHLTRGNTVASGAAPLGLATGLSASSSPRTGRQGTLFPEGG